MKNLAQDRVVISKTGVNLNKVYVHVFYFFTRSRCCSSSQDPEQKKKKKNSAFPYRCNHVVFSLPLNDRAAIFFCNLGAITNPRYQYPVKRNSVFCNLDIHWSDNERGRHSKQHLLFLIFLEKITCRETDMLKLILIWRWNLFRIRKIAIRIVSFKID